MRYRQELPLYRRVIAGSPRIKERPCHDEFFPPCAISAAASSVVRKALAPIRASGVRAGRPGGLRCDGGERSLCGGLEGMTGPAVAVEEPQSSIVGKGRGEMKEAARDGRMLSPQSANRGSAHDSSDGGSTCGSRHQGGQVMLWLALMICCCGASQHQTRHTCGAADVRRNCVGGTVKEYDNKEALC